MRRRRLLGALSAGLAVTSGCLSNVETPSLEGEAERPPLEREDFVSENENARRETIVPSVSLLSVSQTGRGDGDVARVVTPPSSADGNETDGETTNESETETETEAVAEPTPTSGEATVDEPDREFEKPGLYVTDEFWRNRTHVHRYGVDEVTTTVYPNEPAPETSVKVVVAAYLYPRGSLVDTETSDPFRPETKAEQVTVPIDLTPAPDGVPLQYVTAVVPENVDPTAIDASDVYAVMETDPFVVKNGRIERASPPERLSPASGPAFERRRVEGGYLQTLSGRTNGRNWEVSFLAFESAYASASLRSRGRRRAEYVSFELLEGAGNEIAQFIYDAAESNGFTSEFERIQFAVSFVQRLPYVTDDATSGYDDYTQFVMETLTQLSGDCEDTSILLATILESEPFNYDAVLLEPPGHMAVGLLMSQDFDGFAYINEGEKYYYVETTTEGWGIGQIPDQFRESKAHIYDV